MCTSNRELSCSEPRGFCYTLKAFICEIVDKNQFGTYGAGWPVAACVCDCARVLVFLRISRVLCVLQYVVS